MKLEELHELRDRAGIRFTKSFNCIDAEKNIHLADKDKFFKKILERLDKMGYKPLRDFDFEVIRYKFPYAERHHIGQTYEWKYFYSTTFEIKPDLVEFLLFHNFIAYKNEIKKKGKNTAVSFEEALKINERKMKTYIEQEKEFSRLGKTESAKNMQIAIEKCQQRIKNIQEKQEQYQNKRGEIDG